MKQKRKYARNASLYQWLRTILGAVTLWGVWALLGAVFFDLYGALYMFVLTAIVGPIFVPCFTWLSMRFVKRSLVKVSIKNDSSIQKQVFQCILDQPGPKLRVWSLKSDEESFFWCQNLFWTAGFHQEIIVPTKWWTLSESDKNDDWLLLWNQIASMSPDYRRLRSIRIMLWAGVMFPVEALLVIPKFLKKFASFEDLPDIGFFMQSFCWWLYGLWYGEETSGKIVFPRSQDFTTMPPRVWRSVTWGVWHQVPERRSHHFWSLFIASQAYLGDLKAFDRRGSGDRERFTSTN